jgi:hypothetical protein
MYHCGRLLAARKTREKCLHVTIKLFINFKSPKGSLYRQKTITHLFSKKGTYLF